MKRNIELIRRILLACEEHDQNNGIPMTWKNLHLEDVPENVFNYHCDLMQQAGFIDGATESYDDITHYSWIRMRNPGHDFLDDIRTPKIWNRLVKELGKTLESASLAVIAGLAQRLVLQALNLPQS